MPMVEEIEIHTHPLRLAARVWGPPDGPRVLGIHGWLDNAATFDGLAPLLDGVRLVALDLPGHGRAEHHPRGFPYSFVDFVAAAHRATEALGWERFSVVGHSLGAGVAALLAASFPDRVERLAMLEGVGPLSETEEGGPGRLARALEEERRARSHRVPVYPSREHLVSRLHAALGMNEASARTLLDRGLQTVAGGVTWRSDSALRLSSRVRLSESQVLGFLRAIRCPTLVVRATEGMRLPELQMRARLEALASAQVVDVPGGHHVHLDAPERVAANLKAFFAGRDR